MTHTRTYQFPHQEANSAEIRSNLALCSDEILYHRDTYVATLGHGERLAIRHYTTPRHTEPRCAQPAGRNSPSRD